MTEGSLNARLLHAAYHYRPKELAALIEMGADVNTQDKLGTTPLMMAIENKKRRNVKWLIKEGKANLNLQNEAGQNALMIALRTYFQGAIPFLLYGAPGRATGTDLAHRDQYGRTALMYAVPMAQLNYRIFDMVLSAGSKSGLDTIDNAGENVLSIAAAHKYWWLANLLLAKGAQWPEGKGVMPWVICAYPWLPEWNGENDEE